MVIAIICEWFSETMGYAENKLPVAFAKHGCEVHLVTSDLQIYGNDQKLYALYEPYLGPPIVPVGQKSLHGYTLHRLKHYQSNAGIGLSDLRSKLKEIRPDIVYLFEINIEYAIQAVTYKDECNYRLVSESRLHLSVFKPPVGLFNRIRYRLNEGRKWGEIGEKFDLLYPIAPDVSFVIAKYFGQQKSKFRQASLAVDTELFNPISTDLEQVQRDQLRASWGVRQPDILCIYTGRFTHEKGPLLLAQAIQLLHNAGKTQYKALFVGAGDAEFDSLLKSHSNCFVHAFVPSAELVCYYHAADIGVWPKQESTSQLDASACGLPIIISDSVEDIERINGNGLSFEHENASDLSIKIEALSDGNLRKRMGDIGVKKIRDFFSWDYLAATKLKDFKELQQHV